MSDLVSNDYNMALGDTYAFIIQKILDEAINYEGFHFDHSVVDGELTYLSLDWTDSHGRKHYRTLWEKRDG